MLIPVPFRIRRLVGPLRGQCSVLLALALLWATSMPVSAALRIVSVKSVSKQAPSALTPQGSAGGTGVVPPIEGPLMAMAITLTDQRQHADDFDWYATAHEGVDGRPLIPDATSYGSAIALLDSGAATHLVGYPDATRLGLQGDYISQSTFDIGGVCGGVTLDISDAIGFFAHGLQQLDASGGVRTNLMFGQANFTCVVNSQANEEQGLTVPTLLGAPFLFYFPAYIRNSQPTQTVVFGKSFSSPSIQLYSPLDEDLPELAHRVFLEVRPAGNTVGYFATLDPDTFEVYPITPSTIVGGFTAGSLFFTASDVVFTHRGNTSQGRMVVDTGAQATVLSEIAAAELDLDLRNPDFEVEVQGIGCIVTKPGFYVDSARLPAIGGALNWSTIPVVVLNVTGPEGNTIFGIFGNNLTATRDLFFNGSASPPYLEVTAPIVSPVLRITGVRKLTPNVIEVDWRAEPAPPKLYLEATQNLGTNPPQWSTVATNSMGTLTGTMSVTGLVSQQFFRLAAQ